MGGWLAGSLMPEGCKGTGAELQFQLQLGPPAFLPNLLLVLLRKHIQPKSEEVRTNLAKVLANVRS
ncbi:hypothetical protein E2562_038654 [Oryza meyeriana var. granulata]|uniref:Uncharacterized protein n=1 Tax=Oryza meyeriana var. granulata TaxID=110450 RepID=A0A6G1E8Y0_9ORYZ|nr:hypothetical protein E2562_038654 [Oryza meyeriana var. granulata]